MAPLSKVVNVTTARELHNLSGIPNATENQSKSTELLIVVKIACYAAIIVVGTIGNMLLIIAIARTPKHKTSQYLIVNLAAVDLLTCALSIPFDIAILLIDSGWPFGLALCKLIYPLQTVFMAVSVFTLLCMALERHHVMIHPLKPKMSGNMILLAITFIWIVSIGMVSPYSAALQINQGNCIENWPNNDVIYPKIFTLCVFFILYIGPLFIISIAYARIGLRLRAVEDTNATKCFIGCKSLRDSLRQREKQNIRVVKFFVIAVITFAFCLLPFQVMWMWSDFGNGQNWEHFNTLLTFANVMVYANSAVNPFIFGAIGRRYHCWDYICRRMKQTRTSSPVRKFTLVSRLFSKPKRHNRRPNHLPFLSQQGIEFNAKDRNGNEESGLNHIEDVVEYTSAV